MLGTTRLLILLAVVMSWVLTGCVTLTAMSDPELLSLWAGNPASDQTIAQSIEKWPREKTLIEMQQGMAILRKGELTKDNVKRAHSYFESAHLSFDDLRQPENFSKAFTPHAKTPYRGRPYERVFASMMLGLLDLAADGRCDIAIPTFRAAEFADARWKVSPYGTDSPMIYALMYRCMIKTKASSADRERALLGLKRSIRMMAAVTAFTDAVQEVAKDTEKEDQEDPAHQLALMLLEIGIPAALLDAPVVSDVKDMLSYAKTESLKYLLGIKKRAVGPFLDTLKALLATVERKVKNLKEDEVSAFAIAAVGKELDELIQTIVSNNILFVRLKIVLFLSAQVARKIEQAARAPKLALYFSGMGPRYIGAGRYGEIAKVKPYDEADLIANVARATVTLKAKCGIQNDEGGGLIVVLCDAGEAKKSKDNVLVKKWAGLKLWSSTYKATSMRGPRFYEITKGRANFRAGSETVATVAAYTALALMDAANAAQSDEERASLQAAAAVAGLVAGAAWLAGRVANPEADTRHVTNNFESGYLLIPREPELP